MRMTTQQKFSTKLVYSVLVTILLVVVSVFAYGLWYASGSINESQASGIAKGSALEYCLDQGNDVQTCKSLKVNEITRVWPGLTDGSDEYYGTWIVLFTSNKIGIQVSLDRQGKVEYVNAGEPEYPNAR